MLVSTTLQGGRLAMPPPTPCKLTALSMPPRHSTRFRHRSACSFAATASRRAGDGRHSSGRARCDESCDSPRSFCSAQFERPSTACTQPDAHTSECARPPDPARSPSRRARLQSPCKAPGRAVTVGARPSHGCAMDAHDNCSRRSLVRCMYSPIMATCRRQAAPCMPSPASKRSRSRANATSSTR